MFKSKKKRLQQKQEAEAAAAAAAAAAALAKSEAEISKYKLLDDIHLTHDFRSSVILPQLNKNIDPNERLQQQEQPAQLKDIPETLSLPLSPPPSTTFRSSTNSSSSENDGTKQYQDLAAWRHQRSQNRYSNGLFGGKQRGRPKPPTSKRFASIEDQDADEDQDIQEPIHEDAEKSDAVSPVSLPKQSTQQMTREALAADTSDTEQDGHDDDFVSDEEELLHQEYEPDSDTEENFFFQDFSGNEKPKKRTTTNNSSGRRRRSQKVMSKFDLSSFAKDLHDHRLSVIQPRDSRIIMTEDDERELEKLLERQRQRMSMMTVADNHNADPVKVIPPLPPLDLIKPHTTPSAAFLTPSLPPPSNLPPPPPPPAAALASIKKKESEQDFEIEKMPNMNSDHGSSTTDSFSSINGSSPANSSRGSYPPIEQEPDSNKIAVESENEEENNGNTVVNVPHELQASTVAVNLKPVASVSSSSIRPYQQQQQQHHFKNDQLKRSVSTTSIKSNKSSQWRPTPTPLARIRDENEPAELHMQKQQARKSMSMDDMQVKLDINEASVTSSALDWITEDTSKPSPSRIKEFLPLQNHEDNIPFQPQQQQLPKLNKSRGLFGSLRQVNRSRTHHSSNSGVSSLKGLVRNFSTSHHNKPNSVFDINSTSDTATDTTATTTTDTTSMSRAAMAVIQHNVAKHEQKKAASIIPKEDQEDQQQQRKTRQRSRSDANNNSPGSRLIAQLLSRASSSANKSKRSNSTKIVNMQEDSATKKRAQVVRKTIIYVQPDSLHDLLKNGGDGSSVKMPPPLPPPPLPLPRSTKPHTIDTEATRNTIISDGSLSPDDETIRSKEYFTATKVSRQTSVRKRVVEAPENNDNDTSFSSSSPLREAATHYSAHANTGGMLSRNGSRRRWQLQSMDEDELLSPNNSINNRNQIHQHDQRPENNYMEGVELREMSDGSVVWGVVKKQGNRKSFYAPNKQNQLEFVEDEEDNDDEGDENAHGDDYFRNKVMKKSNSTSSMLNTPHSPPPIPRRSPRRQQILADPVNNSTKTDIFYSDQVTLPNLLKMMQEQQEQHEYPGDISEEEQEDLDYIFNERAMSSVDDQLDEMMRILTAK